MRDYARIVSRINRSVWLMTEDGIDNLLTILERHMYEDDDEIRRHAELFGIDGNENAGPTVINGVGILNLEGPIFPKANLMTELSGATSLESFRSDFRGLLTNDSVSSIILNIDSPGGVSDLVMEMAAEIRESRNEKPIFSIANTMAASAAAWIASAAGESYITPSGLGGSIGVYLVHVDRTEQEQKAGIKKTVIKAGDVKAAGEEPLNEATRGNLQDMVDDCYEDFVASVAEGRNLSIEAVKEFADGGLITPRKAVEYGLFDGIKTFDSLLGEVSQNGGVVGNASAVAAMSALQRRGYVMAYGTGGNLTFEPDLEHADPGPLGEPIPREPQMEDDPAVTGGWRVPGDLQPSFPPVQDQPPPTYKGKKGSAMDRTQLVALANLLGIAHEDVEDAELFAAITSEVSDVVVPLTEAAAEADKRRSFAKDYPAEYDKFRELLERDEENEARAFASRWERFEIKEGETVKKSTHGFSGRVLSNIEDIHLKFARKQLQESDIAALLDSIAETGAVDYSERGSARSDDRQPANVDQMGIKDVRALFAAEVKSIMEDDGVDRKAAIKLLGQRNPELAEAYKTGHVRR